MSLQAKIDASLALLRGVCARHGAGRVAAAFTGGKDSTCALDLWRRVVEELAPGGPVRAISVDTGCKFPEVVAFRDRLAAEWGIDLAVARPEVDLDDYPVAVDKVACCLDLKVAPLSRAIRTTGAAALITGIRRDEHPSRAGRQPLEQRTDPDHQLVNPLLDWTEMDVWSYLSGRGLPFCDLYSRGYRSLGCVPCTGPAGALGGERAGRDAEKEAQLARLTSLGYF